MGFADFFRRKRDGEIEITEEAGYVCQPVSGEVIPLEDIGDDVFAAGILGKGCGIRPDSERVIAPFSGTISVAAETGHAVGITGADGVELLIHIGLDTVEMGGEGFEVNVKAGDKVKAGETLVRFNRKAIADAGHPDVVAVLVANSGMFRDVDLICEGNGTVGRRLLEIVR